jgi:putative molybdopterin biosynthesis protein
MEETYLYKQIVEAIRQEIITGVLKAGDQVPPIRQITKIWNCTPGTVQKAYQELARQGLVRSQAGRGTHVTALPQPEQVQGGLSLRSARLVHQAESFLLESLTAGYELNEIQQAVDIAGDRWRGMRKSSQAQIETKQIRFSGSHDLLVVWISGHLPETLKEFSLEPIFTGSLGGLMALAENQADLAGCHLWDDESRSYNLPFIRKLFPGQAMTTIRLANRRLGLICAPGNPMNIRALIDLTKPGIRFVNRQAGSGTRVWLDTTLKNLSIDRSKIHGFDEEKATHSEVARSVAEGDFDAGICLESAAEFFNLPFLPLTEEPYDLVTLSEKAEAEPLRTLFSWIGSDAIKDASTLLPGYDFSQTGMRQTL